MGMSWAPPLELGSASDWIRSVNHFEGGRAHVRRQRSWAEWYNYCIPQRGFLSFFLFFVSVIWTAESFLLST